MAKNVSQSYFCDDERNDDEQSHARCFERDKLLIVLNYFQHRFPDKIRNSLSEHDV